MTRLTIKRLHPLFGDAVMWDNRCTLHRATPFGKTRYKGKLHRTTIAGKAPDSAFASMPLI